MHWHRRLEPSNTAYMLGQFATKLCRFVDLGGDSAVAEAINRHVARHADLFTECLRPALCHNDFHEGNVLVTRDGEGWRVTGYVDVETWSSPIPHSTLAKTNYFALRRSETKRRAFIRGYGRYLEAGATLGSLRPPPRPGVLELVGFGREAGCLADIGTDLEEIISNDAAQ